jgi:hypothetical protein
MNSKLTVRDVSLLLDIYKYRYLSVSQVKESATSGKAGGLKKVEPLKAVRCWEPLKAVRL